jgi:hypothetical protein
MMNEAIDGCGRRGVVTGNTLPHSRNGGNEQRVALVAAADRPDQHALRARFSRHAFNLGFYLKYSSGPRSIFGTHPPQRVRREIAVSIPCYYPTGQLLRSPIDLRLDVHNAATARPEIKFGCQGIKAFRYFKRKSPTIQEGGLFLIWINLDPLDTSVKISAFQKHNALRKRFPCRHGAHNEQAK